MSNKRSISYNINDIILTFAVNYAYDTSLFKLLSAFNVIFHEYFVIFKRMIGSVR